MAIQFMENFEGYGLGNAPVTEEILKGLPWADVYAASSLPEIVADPIDGSRTVFHVFNNGGSQVTPACLRLALPIARRKIGIAFRCIISALPSQNGGGAAVLFKTGGNGRMIGLYVTTTGQFRLEDFDGIGSSTPLGNLIAETNANAITPNTFTHVELTYDMDTGDYALRVESVPKLTGTHSYAPAADIGSVEWRQEINVSIAGAPDFYVTDVIAWDTQGSQNNTFVGTALVVTLTPDGDTSSGWARVGGAATSDFGQLDETTPNDVDYIEADDTLPAASILTMSDLDPDIVTVKALQPMIRLQKTDTGDATVQVGLKSNGSDDLGGDQPMGTTFAYNYDISELNPDGGAAWNPVAVNAMQLQIDRTT